MSLYNVYKKIALFSPFLEICLRFIYWKNIRFVNKLNPYTSSRRFNLESNKNDFSKTLNWLKEIGIKNGDILIVHSSYEGLNTNLSPDQIIDILLNLIGPKGTLVMPVIRLYKNKICDNFNKKNEELILEEYDLRKTPIISGLLPFRLLKRNESVVSLHPLNPLCAFGPLAKSIMNNNISGLNPSPHGKNSSWRFCYENKAKIIGLGVNLEHYNTMIHVADESFGDWIIDDTKWFHKRFFKIVDYDSTTYFKTVNERRPKWGKYYFTEMRLNKDLKKMNILKTEKIDNEIDVGYIDSQELISFVRSKKSLGYPYFFPFSFFK